MLSAVTNYWLVIGITPLMLLFFYYGRYYLRTSRELKRLEAIKCSPVYSHVAETVHGLEVIKTAGMEERFLQLLFRLVVDFLFYCSLYVYKFPFL